MRSQQSFKIFFLHGVTDLINTGSHPDKILKSKSRDLYLTAGNTRWSLLMCPRGI